MKWILELKDKLLERKTAEKGVNAKENKFLGFLKSLKFQCIKIIEKIGNSRVVAFINEKWSSEADYYEMFLTYRELNHKNIDKEVDEYFDINKEIFDSNKAYNNIKQELKSIATEKTYEDTTNMEERLHELDQKIDNMKQNRKSIKKGLSDMIYVEENVVTELKSDVWSFVKKCIKYNPKIIIVYIVCIIINILFFLSNLDEYGLVGLFIWLIVFTSIFCKLIYRINIRAVRIYVAENEELKDCIKEDYRDAFERVKSYGKEKKDETPKPIIKKTSEDLKPSSVQQTKQEEQIYNPYADTWRLIFAKLFKTHGFKVPKYVELDTTEVHIFDIPTLTVDSIIDKSEEIGNYMGKRIYKVQRDYDGNIGKIGVKFITKEIPNLIAYDEVPQTTVNEIVVGKSVESWVTWRIDKMPHGGVYGSTGGGKSKTIQFLINEFVKKQFLLFFADFKGGVEFNIYKKKNYTVITERKDFAEFVTQLYMELKYRNKMLADFMAVELNEVNEKLISENKPILPRIFLIIDEFADAYSETDEYTKSIKGKLNKILAKGRAIGIHVIIGTQRPDADIMGGGAPRNNIPFGMTSRQKNPDSYKIALGIDKISKEDDNLIKRIPDTNFQGLFIVQGTGTIDDKELVRVPFMDKPEFNDMVLNEWEDNPYADYKLHYEEDNEAEEYVEKPVSKVDIQKLEKFKGKYAKNNVVEIQEEYDTHLTDLDINDFIDL